MLVTEDYKCMVDMALHENIKWSDFGEMFKEYFQSEVDQALTI